MIRPILLTLSIVALAAAASPAEAQRRQRDRITREEILESAHRSYDLYQVVRSLRPRFLEPPPGVRSLGNSNAPYTPIAVYVDGKKDIGIEALKLIDPLRVQEVRYYDPERANAEFGPSAANGAIVIRLVRGAAGDTTKPPR